MSLPPLPEPLASKSERAAERLRMPLPNSAKRLFGLSDFAAGAAQRHADWFRDMLDRDAFDQPFELAQLEREVATARASLAAKIEAASASASMPGSNVAMSVGMPELQRALRVIRNRYQLWIVWRHLVARASLEETTRSLTGLADTLIDAALACLHGWQVVVDGQPKGQETAAPQRLVVLALGKLGASELNVSSDVDLILCYPEAGTTSRGKTNQQFFTRLAQQLILALDTVTEDGFVFRVDLRLRPFGASGPVALQFAALEDYYVTHGRDWERYALIKARPCAGDVEAGRQLLATLKPFIYRRYLDFGALDALRDMKARLLAERNNPADIKLGPGGIRDIEFTVQVQQLVWAGRQHELQSPALAAVLPKLVELGHMPSATAQRLERSYRFLRDVEHSLQAEADRQTQVLPTSAEGQTRLALGLGFADYAAFAAALGTAREAAAAIFEEIFADVAVDSTPGEALWLHLDEPDAVAEFGFRNPNAAGELLAGLTKARDRPSVASQSRQRLDRLMPSLLELVRQSADPDLALQRVVPVVRAILRRSAYMALLWENPVTLAHFVELTLASRWLAEELARHPSFFDALLDERQLGALPDRATLNEELAAELAEAPDLERALDVLREFKEHHVFNVALAEVRATLPLMNVSDYLTWLAEAVLEQALALAWSDTAERFPGYETPGRFVIVGFGKLGGIELGPGSDLDLVFIHDLPDAAAQFLHRLVRRLLHVITVPTYLGTLYEVDMRLRPSGNAGTMVSSLKAFEVYERDRAWVWEHQALVRARPVAGDRALAARFQSVRRELLCTPRDRRELARDVVSMRRRMSDHHGSGIDVKRGSGGIVDIEFMVQYLVLAWASEYPELTEFSDNVRILEGVERLGLLPAATAESLRQAYIALRSEWHRTVLDLPDDARAAEVLAAHRDAVTRTWSELFAGSLDGSAGD